MTFPSQHFTTSVKESYLHPYDQVTEEACSDPRTADRCLHHRIIYKTAYRQAVKTEYRKRYQCCPGFYESRNKCVPRCTMECVHGRCIAPDQCQCERGWRGDDCSSDCDDNHWGSACRQSCKCKNGALCDPIKGTCQCPPGFVGHYCEDECPAGNFGKGCLQKCKCGTGGSCHKATGECLCRDGFTGTFCEMTCNKRCQARCPCQNGGICKGKGICTCPPGWTGAVCTEQCPEGRFGPNCTEECVCHNRGECDTKTGQCQCAKGFTGDRCNEECAAGTYGQDCKGVCDCANGARCYNIDGGCLCEPGFHGPQCRERMCALGKYGMHCENTCLCQDKHTLSCHPMKGECTCQPGWAGLFCNETCPHGFYGHGCLEPCLCVNGGVCDGSTGQCQCASGFTVSGYDLAKIERFYFKCDVSVNYCINYFIETYMCSCFKCWQGADCSSQCSEGTWGPGCNSTCLCTNGAKCNPADGSCTCTAGWHGTYCDQMCPMGTFGPGCLKKCDCVHADGCQAATGKCHCLPGWWGSTCSEPCSAGLWGRHCNQTCFKHCPNSDTCLRETGACICRPGFLGETCQNKCRPGTYGEQCSMPCPSCGQSYRCHHVTGKCDCLPGYTGANCDQDCPPGYYGKMCSEVCDICANNSTCNPHDGHCECLPGWTARDCSKREGPVWEYFYCDNVIAPDSLCVLCLTDVPHSYHHYYSNPSYHTLSQNRPPLPHIPNNHEHTIKVKVRSAISSSSLNSENPYATIKDLPGLPFCPPESSYMEMKSAVPRDRAYTEIGPPPCNTSSLYTGD
uniref:Platelet endothelial aggregation receptor 1 n=1 Tax=Takifugu rubripes TaxID=31033 RepID=H2T7C3_TAKRU